MAFSFNTKTDYFGVASNSLILTSSTENKSHQVAQAHNEKGDVIASEVYGETSAPNCTYVLKSDTSLGSLKIGTPITADNEKYTITSINIDTSAGSAPSVSVSGEKVPTNSNDDCYYDIPSTNIKVCHHAQILFGAFQLTGAGSYLTQASYSITASITKATKDGDTIAYDVADGQITASITIQQTGSTKPTVTAGSDWIFSAPMTCSNPDADYPSWTATLAKSLTHHTNVAG